MTHRIMSYSKVLPLEVVIGIVGFYVGHVGLHK
jgi:hypothetical protein